VAIRSGARLRFDSGHVAFPGGDVGGPTATVRMIGRVAEPRAAVRGRRRLLTTPSAFAGIGGSNSALIWPHEQRAQATAETDRDGVSAFRPRRLAARRRPEA